MQHFLNLLEHRSSCRICVSWNALLTTTAIDNRECENNLKYGSIAHSSSKAEEGCERGKIRCIHYDVTVIVLEWPRERWDRPDLHQ